MKKILKLFIIALLMLAMLPTVISPVGAAPLGERFLSDLHLAEASDAATAKKILTDNGYTVLDINLNPNADTAVYLGYKTSSDAEQAITDVSVMNMLGKFNITNYDIALEKELYDYAKMISDLRIAANELKNNYAKGEKKAHLAYRLLNRYYIEQDMEKIKMGDFMLSFPENDEDVIDILLKSNTHILGSLRSIIAMGIGDSGVTLSEKIGHISKDESVYQKSEYNEAAKTLYHTLVKVKSDMQNIAKAIADVEADSTLTGKEKDALTETMTLSFSKLIAFQSIVESFPLKDSTYGEYLDQQEYLVFDYSIFYPIIEAMTEGQRALIPASQIMSVVIYDAIGTDVDKLEDTVDAFEQDFPRLNLFLDSDISIFEGSLAITQGALSNELKNGSKWAAAINGTDKVDPYSSTFLVGLGGYGLLSTSRLYISEMMNADTDAPVEYSNLLDHAKGLNLSMTDIDNNIEIYYALEKRLDEKYKGFILVSNNAILDLSAEYSRTPSILNYTSSYASPAAMLSGSASGYTLGSVIMSLSLYETADITNRYNVEYTDIPTNIVDCIENGSDGSYVRYQVVNAFYYDGDTLKTRAGDTNAYGGTQWNAIYYTKNHQAGKCMTDKIDLPESPNGADLERYTPVHSFEAKDVCYDLNKYSDENDRDSVYIAIKTSNSKKDGGELASLFFDSTGSIVAVILSGIGGIAVGVFIMKTIKKKEETTQ